MATVHSCVDVVLKSESGVSALYDLYGPLSGALTGCKEAVSKENGKRYVIRTQHVSQISKRKQVCGCRSHDDAMAHSFGLLRAPHTHCTPTHPPSTPTHPPSTPTHPLTHPRHIRRS